MLKKLRLKFVVINMALVTAMLCAIFGLIYHFTRLDLERENLSMMRAVAAFPALGRLDRPDEPAEEVRLPYFVLQVEAGGGVSVLGGGYYDLSDTAFLQELTRQAARAAADFGVLEDYKLRFCRVDKARSRDGSFGLGLPIARQIVSAHRGRIWAESHGERIRFYVELPLA